MKNLAILAAMLMFAGCASTSETKMGAVSADFPSVVKEAQADIKKAKSVGGEWRDSGKFLKDAEKAAKEGDLKKAMSLATKAKDEGTMGYEQAVAEKNAGPWLF